MGNKKVYSPANYDFFANEYTLSNKIADALLFRHRLYCGLHYDSVHQLFNPVDGTLKR